MDDLVNLGFAQIYLRLMIDGVGSHPFSARTLPPIKEQEVSFKDEILEASRKNYGRNKEDVEKVINEWNDKSFKVSKAISTNKNESVKTNFAEKRESVKTNYKEKSFSQKPFQKNTYVKKEPIKTVNPEFEGAVSLKDALAGAMKEVPKQTLKFEEKREIVKKQNNINKEIETENKNKLKEAIGGILEEQKKKEEEEKNKLKEVPENVLRELLN
jgi:hypothetical protein